MRQPYAVGELQEAYADMLNGVAGAKKRTFCTSASNESFIYGVFKPLTQERNL